MRTRSPLVWPRVRASGRVRRLPPSRSPLKPKSVHFTAASRPCTTASLSLSLSSSTAAARFCPQAERGPKPPRGREERELEGRLRGSRPMTRIQPVLDERMDPFGRLTVATIRQSQCQSGMSLFHSPFCCDTMNYPPPGQPDNGLMKFTDKKVPPPRLLTFSISCDIDNSFEVFTSLLSRLHQHLVDANAEISYTEYLDLMKAEVDQLLNKLNDDIRAFKSYRWAHDVADDSCSVVCPCGKLFEIGEGFNNLKLLLAVVFQHIKEMLRLVNSSVHDLQWEREFQLEVTGIVIGDCIRGLQDELEGKLYEQSTIISSLKNNWKETVSQCASIREDLIAISNMLLPPEEESHMSHSKHENIGNRSDRWKFSFFGKRTCEDHSSSSCEVNVNSATQKSICPSEVISEKSDFRHLKGMARQEMLNYFRSEISKLKRLHEIDLQERTEELFKFKREKWSLALKYDVEFEPLRKKFPEVISRFDKIMSNVTAAPTISSSSDVIDESSRLKSRIDSLYSENQHLRGLLAKKTREVQELSCQISDANRKSSLQYSLEKQLLRQVLNIEGEYEDFYVESTIKDEIYQNVTRHLVDNHRNILEDTACNFEAKLTAFEDKLLERDTALYLANEENQKLKEKLSILEKEYFIRNNPELMKQESEEMVLRDIEMEPHVSPQRSWEISDQDVHYEELIKLNQTLEIASTTLKEVEAKKMDYSDILGNKEQESQLDCILTSIMDLSKEFVEMEQKMSEEGNVKRTENLNDRCNHMVQQATALTKKGLWYKQMLDTRRSELQKAESEVDILGDKLNAFLSLVQKIYVTLEHYSPVFQQHPVLLDAFLKTCKLVAGIRNRQKEDSKDKT